MADGILLVVHVRPGGRRDAVEGEHDGALAVRVTAPADRGRANDAVRRVLADAFSVRPSVVEIVSGTGSRRKRVRVGGDRVTLERRRDELLGRSVPRGDGSAQ